MGINRISSAFLTNQSVSFLNNNLKILSDIQERISSGRNINNPSDDPVGLTRVLSLSNTLATDARYMRNIEDALSEAQVTDSVISNVVDIIHRSQELAVQGSTLTNSDQNALDALALEVDQMVDQLAQLGNTDISGKYIFGGFATGGPPFARVAGVDTVNYAGTPAAGVWQRPVEISQGVVIDVNVNGQELLGNASVTGYGPPAAFAPGANGLMQTMLNLKVDLENGETDEVRLRIDELTADLNNVLAQQARVGSITNRLELTRSRLEEREAIFTRQFADIQDVDMPKAVSDLAFQEEVFQASLGVTARVIQPSLLNFLR